MSLKVVLSACAFLAFTGPAQLSAQLKVIPTFAGLDWQQSPSFVRDSLKALGFVPSPRDSGRTLKDSAGTLTFTGTLMDLQSGIVADFTPAGLVRIAVVFDVPPDDVVASYRRLAAALTEKYGKAPNLYDGHFGAGMRQAGGYRMTWPVRGPNSPKPNRDNIEEFTRIDLIAIDGKMLNLLYVGPEWPAEHRRREAIKARVF